MHRLCSWFTMYLANGYNRLAYALWSHKTSAMRPSAATRTFYKLVILMRALRSSHQDPVLLALSQSLVLQPARTMQSIYKHITGFLIWPSAIITNIHYENCFSHPVANSFSYQPGFALACKLGLVRFSKSATR